ncbi:RusA family crossover junction endodeoxyribonuclease [Kamptonema animale CS-326]|uniref:RusA family crossover junction endodeoxyribonuclease n=1 Tax=Kamptonema animale TaxID=92934 RepID=UPI00232C1CE7|nr:RusA family crossover junction endodeoxyribonuclease [Kamptonema animale]MDB9513509.1 RusA family crossover junction endodeoxyribonuclease [Kamptonema animale CS-326]
METNNLNKQLNSTKPFSVSEEVEMAGAKTLWLVLSSYLEVLINSAPLPMTLQELGAEIKGAHEQCQTSPMAGLLYARNAGEWLLEAQEKLQPEQWEIWLKANCNLSQRTAETYMQMAKGWPGLPKDKPRSIERESFVKNFIVSSQKDSFERAQSIDYLEEDEELELELELEERVYEEPIITSEIIEDIAVEEPIITSEIIEDIAVEEPTITSKITEDIAVEELMITSEIIEDIAVEEPTITSEITEDSASEESIITSEIIEDTASDEQIITSGVIENITSKKQIITPEVIESLEVVNLSSPQEIITVNVEKLEVFDIPQSREVIIFFIPGNVVPKARPRVTGNGTFMPQRYRTWRNMAEVEIYSQLSELNLTIELPIKRASILMRFVGKHRTNSDLDNLAGACLDALTMNGAGVLLDDRISCVSKLSVEYVPVADKTGVWIEITPVD